MQQRKKRTRSPRLFGFTLLELLIVCGILAVMSGIVLLALNPFEQTNRARDLQSKIIAQDFIFANTQYFLEKKKLPWEVSTACDTELTAGGMLSEMPSCLAELINNEQLVETFLKKGEVKELHAHRCQDTMVLCYNPKSKKEYSAQEVKYTKYGVTDPGCPGAKGSGECYWCKPVHGNTICGVTPTPTETPTQPTDTPAPTPTPLVDYATLYGIGGYKLDETKFFQTYAVLAFPDPGIPPNWMIDVSLRPDFGGTTSFTSIGYSVNGVPATTNTDTIFWVAYAGNGNFGTGTSPSYQAQVKLSSKHFAFISMPYGWSQYVNGCGKKIYWRVVQAPNGGVGYYPTPTGPTYSSTIDCTTKVGVVNYNWYDINTDGVVDWVDYIIGSLQTKLRYGGWQPPE